MLGKTRIDCSNFVEQAGDDCATFHAQLATNEIHCLNAVRAFVDGGDAGIAIMLCNTGLFNETHTAMNLHCNTSEFNCHVCSPAL